MDVVFFSEDFADAMQRADNVTAPVRYGETIDALCLIAVDDRPSVVCGIALNDGQKFHAMLPAHFLSAARVPDVR
ncbi:Crp/Fnr family transcriptional regulator [Pseudomonas syringae pv. coryli]|uniref:Crp/Fnr family transcriptional regulator n=1 Tax=Pseudomonas syringae pv. coryli TaxID=317659 RepID=A0A0P9NFM3_9PSED|nr:Crp/Fnr family transcriptional regulator [Pseudomonas syringae pv. coryli]